jgi:hypothetical protein
LKSSKDKKIYIDSDYAFEISPTCITLSKRRITKKGKLQFDTIGYFTSLEAMYHRMIYDAIEGIDNLQDIAERQAELKNHIGESVSEAALAISKTADTHNIGFLIPDSLAKKKAPRMA